MKLNKKSLRMLIESVLREQAESLNIEYKDVKDLVLSMVHWRLFGFKQAELQIQHLGIDDVTLNHIDALYRKRYRDADLDNFGGGMAPALTAKAEDGIAALISGTAKSRFPEAFQGVDSEDSAEYEKATQKALQPYPGILALFNANK